MKVGERIKARRIELGLSQEELARRVGYKSKSSINKIEISRNMPFQKVVQFAVALDCDPVYLLGWEDTDGIPILFSSDLAAEDVKLLACYHKLSDGQRSAIFNLVKELSKT